MQTPKTSSPHSSESDASFRSRTQPGSGASSPLETSTHAESASGDELRRLHQRYEVLNVVGEGAYGLVMRCTEKGTGRQVAIKEFKVNDKDPDAEDVRRTARREVKLLRELQHPNVVSIVRVCVDIFR